jgi:aminopeptidase YwaD
VSGATFRVHTSPYSLGVVGTGPLVVVSTLDELASRQLTGSIVVLRGEIAAQPLTPKAYPFYQVEEHSRLIAILESASPVAVVAATGRCPEMAGAVHPFPLIEDGDFRIPSGYIEEEFGSTLANLDGRPATIELNGQRRPSVARNVVGRRGRQNGRITMIAHVDTKVGTPGALDNAAGVTTLLLLAEMLDRSVPTGVELLVVNGEDYYSAAGEVHYLREHGKGLDAVALAVNVDGAGYREGRTVYSLYGCEGGLVTHARQVFDRHGLIEGGQWWQSDHVVFAMQERPAIALTSERQDIILHEVIHTADDTVEQVDAGLLVQSAQALRDLVEHFPLAGVD